MRLRAYLVSGEFRVHRAGCRDCEKEARRSDSVGDAGEYASRAEFIASLWPDIIAENPEVYSNPAAWSAWKPRPSSCRAPAGCPALARPGMAASLARRTSWPPGPPGSAWRPGPGRPRPRRLQQAGVRGEQRRPGLSGQVPSRDLGTEGARSLLSDLRPAAARRASAAGAAAPAVSAEQRPPSAPGQ